MKSIWLVIGLQSFALPSGRVAAVTQQQFDSTMALIDSSQFTEALESIHALRKADSADPEAYVLYMNYYFKKALQSYLRIDQERFGSDQMISILDSLGDTIGYMGDYQGFDFDTLGIGTTILRQGIESYPDRLDMRMGLVDVLNQAELYADMVDALNAILNRQMTGNVKWLWCFSQPYAEDADEFIRESTQSYTFSLIQLNSPAMDSLAMDLSEKMTHAFPNSVYGAANLGTLYNLKGDYDRVLMYFQQASVIDPEEGIVIVNLADLHVVRGDIAKAIEQFQLALEIGAPDQQEYAKKRLAEIQK